MKHQLVHGSWEISTWRTKGGVPAVAITRERSVASRISYGLGDVTIAAYAADIKFAEPVYGSPQIC